MILYTYLMILSTHPISVSLKSPLHGIQRHFSIKTRKKRKCYKIGQ